MAVPNILTVIDTIGSGISTMSVSRTSSENIRERLTTAVISVFARYMTAGPTIMRTELRSFVARDIRSPVRFSWKNDIGQPLEVREEIIAQVVFESRARR